MAVSVKGKHSSSILPCSIYHTLRVKPPGYHESEVYVQHTVSLSIWDTSGTLQKTELWRREPESGLVDAKDLVKNDIGPLTELENLDKGWWDGPFNAGTPDKHNYQRSSSIIARERVKKNTIVRMDASAGYCLWKNAGDRPLIF